MAVYEHEGTMMAKDLKYGDIIYLSNERGVYIKSIYSEGLKIIISLRNGETKTLSFNEQVRYKRRTFTQL